jgi:hypothetical protein
MVHKEDERSEALRGAGAEVVMGEVLEHDDVIRAAAGTGAAYFCYPVSSGLIRATAYFCGRGQAGGAYSRCKHVADFCAQQRLLSLRPKFESCEEGILNTPAVVVRQPR